jgi:hypothetical protein
MCAESRSPPTKNLVRHSDEAGGSRNGGELFLQYLD